MRGDMMINLNFDIGDSVGEIYKRNEKWVLLECKITSISITRKGITVKAPKCFNPLDGEELIDNTKDMEDTNGLIFKDSVFVLNDITRPKAERWIEWANNNPDKVKGWWEE